MAEYVEIRISLLQTHEGRRIEVVRADLNGDRTVLESSLTVPASPRQEKTTPGGSLDRIRPQRDTPVGAVCPE